MLKPDKSETSVYVKTDLLLKPSLPNPIFQIEALRRQVESLGGQLMVLVQTRDQPLVAWRDTPARPVIEAVKRQFDPLQQLSRGRLPGVDQHQTRA